jgi:hypothetical protein
LSVGFEVTVDEHLAESEAIELSTPSRVDAAVDVVEADPVAVEIWVIDSARHFQRAGRVTLDSSTKNAAKHLAIRVSEVLRARLFEARVGNGSAPTAAPVSSPPLSSPSTSTSDAGAETSPRKGPLGVELGAAALASASGVGPAFLPLALFDWSVRPEVVLHATLAGFGSRPTVSTAAGEAQIATQYGLLGASYRWSSRRRVSPVVGLALGALRTAVDGRAELPRQGHSVNQWSFVVDASVGAVLRLTPRFEANLAAHVQLAEPYVAIRFGEQTVASAGRPNLLLTLTLGAWL